MWEGWFYEVVGTFRLDDLGVALLSGTVKSAEVVYLPFDKTSSMTVSGTGTSPMVRLAHATSRVGSPASMTPAVIIVFVCSRLVSDM